MYEWFWQLNNSHLQQQTHLRITPLYNFVGAEFIQSDLVVYVLSVVAYVFCVFYVKFIWSNIPLPKGVESNRVNHMNQHIIL